MTRTATVGVPQPGEYNPYYDTYIKLVNEQDILAALKHQINDFRALLEAVPESETNRLHQPYTWTIKQVVGHLVDCERVFGFRANCFAAADETPLPGFDQDRFVANMDYELTTLPELTDELEQLRRSNIGLLSRIADKAWKNVGSADGNKVTVGAIAYILVGHIRHHLAIIEKRLAG